MTEELLAFLKNARDGTIKNKLDLFLSLSEKIIFILLTIESQNKLLHDRISKLEALNKTAVPLTVTPPPSSAPSVPANTSTIHQSLLGELKILFKKREDIGK